MIIFIIIQYFFGGGIGGVAGKNDALTFSVDFGKEINPTLNIGTKLTMSLTGNAPDHYDIPFYNWSNPSEYPEGYFVEYRERNEVAAQFVTRKYLGNFILIGSTGFSMQEYITLANPDSLDITYPIPVDERDAYYFTFGAGMGIRIKKFDLCLTYSNRFGALFYFTREFGFKGNQDLNDGEENQMH
jgi:hypothetical protein